MAHEAEAWRTRPWQPGLKSGGGCGLGFLGSLPRGPANHNPKSEKASKVTTAEAETGDGGVAGVRVAVRKH